MNRTPVHKARARLLVINNMPAYYRTSAFKEIAEAFASRIGGSTLVAYQVRRATRERAEWFYASEAQLPFAHAFVQSDFRYAAGRKLPASPGARILLRYRPTHVFTAGWDTPFSLAASAWARFTGAKLGVWVESSPLTSKHSNEVLDFARRTFLGPARFAVVPTEASRQHVDRLAGRPIPARVLLNPVDLDRLEDAALSSRHRAILLGDLSRRKGFDVFSGAAPALRAMGIESHAWGRDIEGLASAASSVHLHDPVPLANILPALRSTDVLVIPSRVDPAPLTYSEALALGLRVVVSDTIAYADHAALTRGAVVADCTNTDSLADAVRLAAAGQRPDAAAARQVSPEYFAAAVVDALVTSDGTA